MRFFFYGTLIDPDVRRLVLRADGPTAEAIAPAILAGWERRAVKGATYPIIVPRAGGRVDGVLASGVGWRARRRLIAYEGDGYDLIECEVTRADGRVKPALVFAPSRHGAPTPAPSRWHYATWQRRHKRRFLAGIV